MKRPCFRKMFFIFLLLIGTFSLMTNDLASLSTEQLEEKLAAASGSGKLQYLDILARKYSGAEREKSISHARHMFDLAKQQGDTYHMVRALNHLGANYYVAGRFDEALKLYLRGLDFQDELKKKDLIGNLLTNIGMVYWRLGQPVKSGEFHRRAVAYRKKHGGSPTMLAASLNNLGLALTENGKLDEALDYYHQSLELARQTGSRRYREAALNNIGILYANFKNQPGRALEYFKQMLPIHRETGDSVDLSRVHDALGDCYLDLKRFDRARFHMEKSLRHGLDSGDQYRLYAAYGGLTRLERETGNYKAALDYKEKYEAIADKLFDQSRHREITRMEARMEAEQKEQNIHLLQRTRQNQRLQLVFLAVAVLLALAAAGFIYSRLRVKKRANQLLQAGDARYRALFDNAAEAIMISDENGYIQCNRKTLDMFGVSEVEAMGRSYLDFSPGLQPDGRESAVVGAQYRDRASKGEYLQFNWRYAHKDGSPRDVMVSLAPITLGKETIIQVIAHDISDSIGLQEERIKAARLETTTQLAEGIAHDFNNLLAIILGNLDMAIEDAPQDSRVGPLLKRVEKAAKTAAEMAAQFRRISEGQLANINK